MSERLNLTSGAVWEDIVGYSRAVRVGNLIEVTGTTAVEGADTIIGLNDPAEQTRFILRKIETVLREAGAELKDVIRTRIYVTNIDDWEAIGRAHAEFFRDIKPATTMVEVSRLIRPDLLVEIEARALITPDN